ncbi:MAG: NAD(P)/FAD-dependent oxidoreductase [Spirochaetia bacterium]|nr:NAD(P)/FAD-dependent oxidoreductase [Spirochaetia bacterium]
MREYDVVIIGSGPNGLAAAIALAEAGRSVLVLEGATEIGGGTRTTELTLPGFLHDVCSGAHPMGILSPYLKTLPLEKHGLKWILPEASVAHPLDDGPAVLLTHSVQETAGRLGADAKRYAHLIEPFMKNPEGLLADSLAPLGVPDHPFQLMRFGLAGIRSANAVANRFKEEAAKALFAGCAAHSILPFSRMLSGAVGLMFLITAHMKAWPVAAGGSASISQALSLYLKQLGGAIETNRMIHSMRDLPPARAYMFDTDPLQLAKIAESVLPAGYVKRLRSYRYGPGVFKMDWALNGPIPWRDPACLKACTVHLGGTFAEIAAGEDAIWRGHHPEKPFVLVVQQSQFDSSRAPPGKHTGYAYCHVPSGSDVDLTDIVESQMERFAPGFRDLILARNVMRTKDLYAHNPNYFGGAITGGVADLFQLFTRPVLRLDPYSTPNNRIFICSASTPPGAGVHGMCGYHAAQSVLRKTQGSSRRP